MFETFMQVSQVSASWAAAIGTTFAACVALWLGLGDRRRRDNDRKLMARTLRFMIGAELIAVHTTLRAMPTLISALKEDYFGDDEGETAIDTIKFAANRLSIPIADASKQHFIHLPPSEAGLAAGLVGEIPRFRSALEEWADRYHQLYERRHEAIDALADRAADIVLGIEKLGWTE